MLYLAGQIAVVMRTINEPLSAVYTPSATDIDQNRSLSRCRFAQRLKYNSNE